MTMGDGWMTGTPSSVTAYVSRSGFASSVNATFPSGLVTRTSGILMRCDRRDVAGRAGVWARSLAATPAITMLTIITVNDFMRVNIPLLVHVAGLQFNLNWRAAHIMIRRVIL